MTIKNNNVAVFESLFNLSSDCQHMILYTLHTCQYDNIWYT